MNFIVNKVNSVKHSKGLRIILASFIKQNSNSAIRLNDGQIFLLFTAADERKIMGILI